MRRETVVHEKASHDYAVTGSKIIELAKNAHNLFIRQDSAEQARLLKILLSNCTFDRGSLSATYSKPFDLLAEGNETGNWLGGRDSHPDNVVQSHVSCLTERFETVRLLRSGPSTEGAADTAAPVPENL